MSNELSAVTAHTLAQIKTLTMQERQLHREKNRTLAKLLRITLRQLEPSGAHASPEVLRARREQRVQLIASLPAVIDLLDPQPGALPPLFDETLATE